MMIIFLINNAVIYNTDSCVAFYWLCNNGSDKSGSDALDWLFTPETHFSISRQETFCSLVCFKSYVELIMCFYNTRYEFIMQSFLCVPECQCFATSSATMALEAPWYCMLICLEGVSLLPACTYVCSSESCLAQVKHIVGLCAIFCAILRHQKTIVQLTIKNLVSSQPYLTVIIVNASSGV